MKVWEALEKIKERHNPYYGICANLREWLIYDDHDFNKFCSQWEHYSGNKMHPVPSPISECKAIEAYVLFDKWEGRYGDLRRSLLDHLIECYKAEDM